MCLAIYQPPGKSVPEEILDEAVRKNSDGWGILVWKDGVPHIAKSMDNKRFLPTAKAHAGERAILHCRIGTSGDKTIENVHPFAFFPAANKNETPLYVAHNGILRVGVVDHSKNDTWHFARWLERIVAPYQTLADPGYLKVLEELIGTTNKLLIGGENEFVSIINEGAGAWKDGIWYSNTYSLPSEKKAYACGGWVKKRELPKYIDAERPWTTGEAVWEKSPGCAGERLVGWRQYNGVIMLSDAEQERRKQASKKAVEAATETPQKEEKQESTGALLDVTEEEVAEVDLATTNAALACIGDWMGMVASCGHDEQKLQQCEDDIAEEIEKGNYTPLDVTARAIRLLIQREMNRPMTKAERRAKRREERQARMTALAAANRAAANAEVAAAAKADAERDIEDFYKGEYPLIFGDV
jgi:hypothetical protein